MSWGMESLSELLDRESVIRVPRHQQSQASRLVRNGCAVRLLPGVLASSAVAHDWRIRALAVPAFDADAVLTAAVAARLTFWPSCPLGTITFASAHRHRLSATGYAATLRTVDPMDQVVGGGITVTTPAMTALDLVTENDASSIDQLLRSRFGTLDQLQRALVNSPHRAGNHHRLLALVDSAMEPWSAAERHLHRSLRRKPVGHRWVSNHPILCGTKQYYADVAIPSRNVIIEVDGFEFHSSRDAFENDRVRQNDLVLAGWVVLRFTWLQLTNDPAGCLDQIRQACRLGQRRRTRSTWTATQIGFQ